jgi:hypothetical protein
MRIEKKSSTYVCVAVRSRKGKKKTQQRGTKKNRERSKGREMPHQPETRGQSLPTLPAAGETCMGAQRRFMRGPTPPGARRGGVRFREGLRKPTEPPREPCRGVPPPHPYQPKKRQSAGNVLCSQSPSKPHRKKKPNRCRKRTLPSVAAHAA